MNLPQKIGLYNPENEHDACGIGFVAHIKGEKSHKIVKRGLSVLENMAHRGAEGADNKSGDGAGITLQIPHEFLLEQDILLPEPGLYGTGLIFLPKKEEEATWCKEQFARIIKEENVKFIQFRVVPVNPSILGEIALSAEPTIEQVFISVQILFSLNQL